MELLTITKFTVEVEGKKSTAVYPETQTSSFMIKSAARQEVLVSLVLQNVNVNSKDTQVHLHASGFTFVPS